MNILVTGAAGFIGSHVAARLRKDGHSVLGLDNFNAYYDTRLKWARVEAMSLDVVQADVSNARSLQWAVDGRQLDMVVHLAAQAGVRYSIERPDAYVQANVVGFLNVLEQCRTTGTPLLYASSSSVYGNDTPAPFAEDAKADKPESLYAATKRANELMAHAYSKLYGFPTLGLRFFTVYGPWGRPDMAVWKWTEALTKGQPISLYNDGNLMRDWTYIDDVVEAVTRLARRKWGGADVVNVGGGRPMRIDVMAEELARWLNVEPTYNLLPMHSGDVYETCADETKLHDVVGYIEPTPLWKGVEQWVRWYRGWTKGA